MTSPRNPSQVRKMLHDLADMVVDAEDADRRLHLSAAIHILTGELADFAGLPPRSAYVAPDRAALPVRRRR